jgi:hypothetical protein
MTRICERSKSLAAQSCILALGLVLGLTAAAGAADMAQWPFYFDGVTTGMGPYGWVDGPTYLKNDANLANGVFGGQVGNLKLYVCRSLGLDGTHPGKYFNGQCNIGWGGKEYAVTSGYELLVNTQPTNAKYFPQTWVPRYSHEGNSYAFRAGAVGAQHLLTCRASHMNGTHLGKEWAGKCQIGFAGDEVGVASYEVLNLRFDKDSWKAAGSPNPTVQSFSTSGGNWYQGVTVVFPNLNLTTNATPIQIPPTNIDTTNYVAKMLNDFNAAYAASLKTSWQPGYLGTGLSKLATTLPDLMYSMIDKYNADQTNAALRKDRTAMYNGLVGGDVNAQSFMILLIVNRAKSILESSQAWTVDETGLINFLLIVAQEQRLKAAGQAKQDFEAWKVSDREGKSVGLLALTYTPSKPPPEFLAMARSGYAVTPALAFNFGRIIATSAGLTAAAGGAIAAGLTGLGSSVMVALSSSLGAGAVLHSMVGVPMSVAGATAGFAGTVAVVAMLVTSGIVKGVELAEYDQYVKDMDAAIADAKNPVSAPQLKTMMNTGDGVARMVYWLAAQAATGTR